MTQLVAGDELGGFPLPKNALPFLNEEEAAKGARGKREQWHPMTRDWWEAWRRSPQASRMLSEPDWYFLLDTALIHHNMWKNGRWEFASEVRLRAAKFGATPEDRMRLRAEIVAPEKYAPGESEFPEGATVTDMRSRKARLMGE